MRVTKRLQNALVVTSSGVLFSALLLCSTVSVGRTELLGEWSDLLLKADNAAYRQQATVRRLADFIEDQYRIPTDRAHAIVSEAFRYGAEHELDPELILAIIAVESTFQERAVSPRGARGLMQVLARAHPTKIREIGGAHALFDAKKNIHTGAKILNAYLDASDGNLRKALARYNGSLKNPRSRYPDKVLRVYQTLKSISGSSG